ncbi:MAG: alkaline phosphatase family protein [Parvularculaceae bacterium]
MACKTLLFGFDGLETDYLDQLIDEGLLPNFKALRDQSRHVPLGVYPGMGAGAFWASGATGVTPADHGRYFFLQFNPETYDVAPFHERHTYRRRPFWEDLDEAGKHVAVIDWHRAPFGEMKHGAMIDNWLGHDAPSALRTSPPELAQQILDQYGHDPVAGGYANFGFTSNEDHRRFTQGSIKRIEYKTRLAVDMLTDEDWDVFIPCFTELHDLGHYYMQLTRQDHEGYSQELLADIGEPLRECYRAIDRSIPEIRKAAGENAVVMMLAGPGMEPLISANGAMDEIALKLDLGVAPPVTPGQAARRAYRALIPRSLRMRFSSQARRARQIFADHDYKGRRFFAVPHNDNSGCIRVNLKGRERFGTVEPGAEFDAVLEEIKAGLLSLRNAETGAPAVSRVSFTRDAMKGAYTNDLPDIFAEWDRTHNRRNFTALTSERTGAIKIPPHLRTGDHTRHGVFWSTGADHPVFHGDAQRMPHETVAAVMASLA